MLSLIPTVLLTDAKAGFVADYAIGKLVVMSELGLTKIISGVDESCGDDKVSSFVETWIFPDAGEGPSPWSGSRPSARRSWTGWMSWRMRSGRRPPRLRK